MDLGISFDQNYLTPFYALITSIFLNNPDSEFHIHTIVTGVSESDKKDMKDYVEQHNSTIFFYEISPESIARLSKTSHAYLTVAAYYRMFFPALVPSTVQKILYLDTDIIVIGNLAELYNTNLNGYPAAAVAEVNATPSRPDLGIHEIGSYFNSGVMLMNVPEWKAQNVTERAIQFVQDFPEKIVWMDQDALNVVLMNNYVKLHPKYNVIPFDIPLYLPKIKYREFLSSKVIIHYTLKEHKPWVMFSVNKFKFLYYYYLRRSPIGSGRESKHTQITNKLAKKIAKVRVARLILKYPKVAGIISVLAHIDFSEWLF
ncbi:glycosyltransferase family 8 protein [Mucilaginibacter lacusdianchii]|uniref:glycosyltransferase family 8 protein n=1 Tax=Mucilaginibacter lacusdianchii TaxID=2684211 RepID=UPI00131E0FDC|nr:glycosyltransferase family 8 protein [Mucilaginibacter sp. JXJ CY 39]